MADAPNSYKDPYWSNLAGTVEAKLDLPKGLLSAVVTRGERSNHDQVSSAGAKTVFQITPGTRKLAIDKYGIDPYLSPENAAEVAGRLLKDSLDRNQGSAPLAVAEYIGGTDRSNWGPQTRAYVKRVVGAEPIIATKLTPTDQTASASGERLQSLSDSFGQWMKDNPASAPVPGLDAGAPDAAQPDTSKADALAAEFGQWRKTATPEPAPTLPPTMLEKAANIPGAIVESVTGAKRATAQTEALPDWATMPELNDITHAAGWKTGLGTLLANPSEAVQIIKANYPGVQVSQDEKGNYLLTSSMDGKQYAIKPGFQVSDIPRAGSAIAAFTPAGRATSVLGAGAASAGTQAAIEATQAATGGNFDTGDVVRAGIMGAAIPAAGRVIDQGKQLLQSVRGAPADVAASPMVRVRSMDGVPTEPAPGSAVQNVASTVSSGAEIAPRAPVAPMAADDLANTARTAAEGGIGSGKATQALAEQAMPNPKTIEAAKRLGIEDYLQPDHVTTNQAYRELAQAVKSVPGSEARAAEVEGLQQAAKKADDIITRIGGTTDVSALDAGVKKALQTTQAKLDGQAEMLYGKVAAMVPDNVPVMPARTVSFLQYEAERMGGVENLAKVSPVEARLLKNLAGDEPVTYAYLDSTRKQIGQALSKASGPFKDSESGLLKKLYATLSEDQTGVARSMGDDAFYTYKAAQYATTLKKGVEDDLSSLFGKQISGSMVGDLTNAMTSLPKGDTSKLVNLLNTVPNDMRQQVVASGLNTAFGKTAKSGTLNFNSFANWYEGLLRNKQAHAALMTNLPPEARKQLSDLYRVSNGIRNATRERITTGRIMAVQEQLKGADTLMSNLYSFARRAGVGAAAEAVTTPMGLPGSGLAAGIASALTKGKPNALKAADALIASPEFVAAARAGGTPEAQSAVRSLAYSKAFDRYVRAIGAPREMADRERWILNAMQATNNLKGSNDVSH